LGLVPCGEGFPAEKWAAGDLYPRGLNMKTIFPGQLPANLSHMTGLTLTGWIPYPLGLNTSLETSAGPQVRGLSGWVSFSPFLKWGE
jgi:hypothetical protein